MKLKRGIIALGLLSAVSLQSWAQQLKGIVIDKNSKETLIGAVISIEGTDVKAVTDVNGNFSFEGLKDGTYTLYIKYVGYKTLKIDGVQMRDANLTIALQPDEQQLKGVTVTAVERRNTDAAMIQVAKSSPVIVSNVSAQEISRTQDTNAGEVIRRVPGVSLIDDKFVMVRGLSQRYNNVWVNGGAVPSSEADSRAFSFDIIPSSQIDNLTIVKSPTAEYPADYSGGFNRLPGFRQRDAEHSRRYQCLLGSSARCQRQPDRQLCHIPLGQPPEQRLDGKEQEAPGRPEVGSQPEPPMDVGRQNTRHACRTELHQ